MATTSDNDLTLGVECVYCFLIVSGVAKARRGEDELGWRCEPGPGSTPGGWT